MSLHINLPGMDEEVRRMNEYWDYLVSESKRPSPWASTGKVRYTKKGAEVLLPRITTVPLGKKETFTLGEELIRRIQLGEDPDEVYKQLLYRGSRQPGATRKGVERYLKRSLAEAIEEGRL